MRRSKSLKVSQGHESILWKELLVNFTSFFFFSSSSVTFSFFSDTTKKTNALTGTFFFLLLHLLLFPSKGKKKNQTYLLSQTLKFLTNVTNHFCSLFLCSSPSGSWVTCLNQVQKVCFRESISWKKSTFFLFDTAYTVTKKKLSKIQRWWRKKVDSLCSYAHSHSAQELRGWMELRKLVSGNP